MHRVFDALRPLIGGVVRHPLIVLLLAAIVSTGGFLSARHLSIDTDLANLIPEDYPSVIALNRLRDTVGGESDAAIAIERGSLDANRAFAEAFIPRALALTGTGRSEPYFKRVDYKRDVDFLEDNALYFGTPAELDQLEDWLHGKIEDARLEANPFYFDLDDDEPAEPDSVAEELKRAYDDIVSREYPISDDSTAMVLRFYPSSSQSNLRFIEDAYRDFRALVDSTKAEPEFADTKTTVSGRMERQLIEIKAIQKDVAGSFGVGVLSVLFLVVFYFAYKAYRARAGTRWVPAIALQELARTPAMALVIAVPLIMSLSWTFGLAYLTYGKLNLMTSTLGLVLFGLGIDFGIHFYARYSEERARGRSVEAAAEETFMSTGQAIAVGALTTAAALFVLMFADFRGFSEFGLIAGSGILLALVAMLLVLPAVVSILERLRILNLDVVHTAEPASAGPRRIPLARGVVIVSLLLVAVALAASTQIGFEYQFGSLEPTYADYNARRDVVRRVYNDSRSRNPAYIVVDDPAEVRPVVEAVRAIQEADTLSPTIDRVESLQDRFPDTPESQAVRLGRLSEIRALLADPFLATDDSEDMQRMRQAASTTAPISLDQIPVFLRQTFESKDGTLGNFVIIYPSVGLSDGRQSMAFSDDIGTVTTPDGRVYHAGSTSLVAADMLKLMQSEAPWMVLATFVMVILLMLVNFASVRWALIALVPLVVGVLWMLLAVELLGLKLNFYNLVVLPAVLGIGNDAGVHIAHRYRELGPGSLRTVLRSTGEHVTMSSITTMVGFGGLLLSFHPGLHSIGELAVVGIGATLAAALIFLPAMLQVLEERS